MVKKIILLLIFIFLGLALNANTYYFSTSIGNNSNTSTDAQFQATPWQTLSKLHTLLAAGTITAGDEVLFKRGETFFGNWYISQTGTSGNHIKFGAYGAGTINPRIVGLVGLTSWTNLGSNKWETTSAISGGLDYVNIVTKDTFALEMGRFPNSNVSNSTTLRGWSRFNGGTGGGNATNTITDGGLSTGTSWAGGEIVMAPERWVIVKALITVHNLTTKTLTFFNPTAFPPGNPASPNSDSSYFIQNLVTTLDRDDEWFYDPTTKKLTYYYGSNPNALDIAITTRDTAIYATGKSYINIDSLDIIGYNQFGINMQGGSNNTVTNCSFISVADMGVWVTGTSCQVYNNRFKYMLNTAIQCGSSGVSSTNTIVRRNVIDSVSMIPGGCMTAGFTGNYNSAFSQGYGINVSGTGMKVDSNILTHLGFIAINIYKWNNIEVSYNVYDSFDVTKDDGGGIYSYIGTSHNVMSGIKVHHNLALHGVGAYKGAGSTEYKSEGIYADLNSNGQEWYNNGVYGCSKGFFLNYGDSNLNIHNNIIYGSAVAMYVNSRAVDWVEDNIFNDNSIWATGSQTIGRLISNDTRITGLIDFDNNRYFKTTSNSTPYRYHNPSSHFINFTSWKVSPVFQDPSTVETTYSTTDSIRVVINPTMAPMVLDLTSGGNAYNWTRSDGTSVSSLTLNAAEMDVIRRGSLVSTPPPTGPGFNLRKGKVIIGH